MTAVSGPGRLRVLLGAAPGVGKTFAMLEEGRRLAAAGTDIVVAVVETHGRSATARLVEGLEVIPRRSVIYRGVALDELDVDAVLARNPAVALVDELAHTNAPGSSAAKRWLDVARLVDAGIDVISTVNVQHIESLGDVVARITGAAQRETIPDAVLRQADQVELVDLDPRSLRQRLGDGLVYPPERVDAAMANFFRLGNLTALRELALLWLADEVEEALRRYRDDNGISATWESRERIVVALSGDTADEDLVRRAARIAARSGGGRLFALHVANGDGLVGADPGVLEAQRRLVETFGGTFHQLVGERVPETLIEFARSVNATQIVLGVSRRNRVLAVLGGAGIGATVIRGAGDIDVHLVAHPGAGSRALPTLGGALSRRRRIAGFVLALAGLPLLTLLLSRVRSPDSITSEVLAFQLAVVVIALVGGLWPALVGALAAGFFLDFYFVAPIHTIRITEPSHALALLIFVVVAVAVSVVVDQAARRSRAAVRLAAESQTLATVAGSVLRGRDALEALVDQLREAFALQSVTVSDGSGLLHQSSSVGGDTINDEPLVSRYAVGSDFTIELRGRRLPDTDRRIFQAFVAQIESALQQRRLTAQAEELRPLAEADRVRTALLAALGHDLRRPLAAATAAVTSLRTRDVTLSAADSAELLATADESLSALASLVDDLLDVSRLRAGELAVTIAPVHLDEVILLALDELALSPGEVRLQLDPGIRPAFADATLLQRVVVNLLGNALRYSPEPPVITTSAFGDRLELRVVDTGPGVPESRREQIFVPFQRLGDVDNTTGIGLGLSLSKGFVEGMGGTLEAEDTPGGGLTMVVALRSA